MDVVQMDKVSKLISPPANAADVTPPSSGLTYTPSTAGFDSVTLSTLGSPCGTVSYESKKSSRSASSSRRSTLSSNKNGRLSALEREQREMKRALADVQSKLDLALQSHQEVEVLRQQDREQKRIIQELERQLQQRQPTNSVDQQELHEEVPQLREINRNQKGEMQELTSQLQQHKSTESMVSEDESLDREDVHLSNTSLEKTSKQQPFSAKRKLKGVIHTVLIITKLSPSRRKVDKRKNEK